MNGNSLSVFASFCQKISATSCHLERGKSSSSSSSKKQEGFSVSISRLCSLPLHLFLSFWLSCCCTSIVLSRLMTAELCERVFISISLFLFLRLFFFFSFHLSMPSSLLLFIFTFSFPSFNPCLSIIHSFILSLSIFLHLSLHLFHLVYLSFHASRAHVSSSSLSFYLAITVF